MAKGIKITVDKLLSEIEYVTLAEYQAAVGGFIEPVTLHTDDTMFINEEGKLQRLPVNWIATDVALRVLMPGDVIVGDAVFVGDADDQGVTLDLSDAGRQWVMKVANEAGATIAAPRPT